MHTGLGKLIRILTTIEMMRKLNFGQLRSQNEGSWGGWEGFFFSGGHFPSCLVKSDFIIYIFSRTSGVVFPVLYSALSLPALGLQGRVLAVFIIIQYSICLSNIPLVTIIARDYVGGWVVLFFKSMIMRFKKMEAFLRTTSC